MMLKKFSSQVIVGVTILGLVLTFGCYKESAQPEGTDAASLAPKAENQAPPAGYEFENPVRLKGGEEYVTVESPGYACPTLADVDEDGKLDLIVGQFSNGHMQFFKNIAADGAGPEFAAAEWIKTGDERAVVPGVW